MTTHEGLAKIFNAGASSSDEKKDPIKTLQCWYPQASEGNQGGETNLYVVCGKSTGGTFSQ